MQKLFRCDIMSKHAKNQIDWSAVLELFIIIITAVKELVKKANENETETEANKENGNQD